MENIMHAFAYNNVKVSLVDLVDGSLTLQLLYEAKLCDTRTYKMQLTFLKRIA